MATMEEVTGNPLSWWYWLWQYHLTFKMIQKGFLNCAVSEEARADKLRNERKPSGGI